MKNGTYGYLKTNFPINSKYGFLSILAGLNEKYVGTYFKTLFYGQKFEIETLAKSAKNSWFIGSSTYSSLLGNEKLFSKKDFIHFIDETDFSESKLRILNYPKDFKEVEDKLYSKIKMWTFRKLREVIFQTSQYDEAMNSNGNLFVIQIPSCYSSDIRVIKSMKA